MVKIYRLTGSDTQCTDNEIIKFNKEKKALIKIYLSNCNYNFLEKVLIVFSIEKSIPTEEIKSG